MTLDEIRRQVRAALDRGDALEAETILEPARELRQRQLDRIIGAAEAERRDLHASETREFEQVRRELDQLVALNSEAIAVGRASRDVELAEHRARRDAANALADLLPPVPGPSPLVRVGTEPRTYNGDPTGPSFFGDLLAMQRYGDRGAAARLERHQAETSFERRDIGVSAMAGGWVPPAYLIDQYAAYARAGRPVGNLVASVPLPDTGMSVEISRITTGTAVASQATENTAVQETNADDTLLSCPVVTIAGQQDLSRQLVERSQGAVDQMIFADLAAAYAAELDRQLIVGDGTGNTHTGILSVASTIAVTYTDASPTVAEALPKLADAIQQIQSNRYAGPTAIVMHPRRWAWILNASDSTGRPLVSPSPMVGPNNAAGVQVEVGYGTAVGQLAGLPVFTDANVPTNLGAGTNEDRIIVANFPDLVLFENAAGAPFSLTFEDVGSATLTVKLVAYGYSAFAAGRYPKSIGVISGTGLVTPTF